MKKVLKKFSPLFAMLVLFLLLFLPGRLIKVKEINCSSQYGDCSPVVLEEIENLEGKNLTSVKQDLLKILDNEISVKDFRYHFNFPENIEVTIIEKKPKYALFFKQERKYANIDGDGYVISFSESSELPFLFVDGALPEVGSKVDERYKFSLDLIYDVFFAFQIKQGTVDNDSLVIEIPDKLRVIFPIEGDREVLVGSLVLLYAEYQNQQISEKSVMADIRSIDLRYKNPVLKKG